MTDRHNPNNICSEGFPCTSSAEQIDEWHKQRVTKSGEHWKGSKHSIASEAL